MRRCLLFAFAAAVLFSQPDTVDCLVVKNGRDSIFQRDPQQEKKPVDDGKHPRHHHGDRRHHTHGGDQPLKAQHGSGYRLLSLFVGAMHYGNYTMASDLLYDGGRFLITDISCGDMDKTAFMTLAQSDNVADSQVILGEWTETAAGFTIVQAEVGAFFGASGNLANQTYYNPSVYYLVTPTLDGSQIASLQRWTDGSYKQANATAMIGTFNKLVAAATLADINTWRTSITPEFVFSMFFPFDERLPYSTNATIFLDVLFHQYQNQLGCIIKVRSILAVCDFVGAEVMVFTQHKQGPPRVHKFFMSLRLDWLMRVNLLQQFGLGYM